jgi:hypothetical protein
VACVTAAAVLWSAAAAGLWLTWWPAGCFFAVIAAGFWLLAAYGACFEVKANHKRRRLTPREHALLDGNAGGVERLLSWPRKRERA